MNSAIEGVNPHMELSKGNSLSHAVFFADSQLKSLSRSRFFYVLDELRALWKAKTRPDIEKAKEHLRAKHSLFDTLKGKNA